MGKQGVPMSRQYMGEQTSSQIQALGKSKFPEKYFLKQNSPNN